ncbi:MAG: hypothetical protein IT379_09775 [Deltaproteobacteria bacterium]|nr:hypothetical protein [Deltaproteobacteria bacterium]
MQYTLRNIPKSLDRALREKARRERRSLNEVAIEAMATAIGLRGEPPRQRDLEEIAGSWVRDAKVERALDEQRRIDPDVWR